MTGNAEGFRGYGHLSADAAARDRARRTMLWTSVVVLALFSIAPVFVHHVTERSTALLSGVEHVGRLCLVALHVLLAPFHSAFHAALALGLGYALWDRASAWRRMREVLGALDAASPEPGDRFWAAATSARVDPAVVRVVEGLPNPAFTVGWLRPRIYVARALADRLAPAELAALIAHEGAHVARRDPLRLSVLRFFACLLFWLPVLRRLVEDMVDEAEVEADDRAAGDQPLVLAAAIVRVAEWTQAPWLPARAIGAVGFTCRDTLERRVRRLAGEEPAAPSHVTRRSVAGALAALMLVWASGATSAHPLADSPAARAEAGHTSEHCTHHEGFALGHLFCYGWSRAANHDRCPHEGAAAAQAHATHRAA